MIGEGGGIGAIEGWGLYFFRDSRFTSVPSSLLIVIALCVREAVGTNALASVFKLRLPGAEAVAGVGGGEDMLMGPGGWWGWGGGG